LVWVSLRASSSKWARKRNAPYFLTLVWSGCPHFSQVVRMSPWTLPRGLPPLHDPKDVILRPTRFEALFVQANFVELRKGEVRRIPLPRTPVNKAWEEPRHYVLVSS
jgi:hypothetical protein